MEIVVWLRWSRQLAITLIGYIQDNGMKKLGVRNITEAIIAATNNKLL